MSYVDITLRRLHAVVVFLAAVSLVACSDDPGSGADDPQTGADARQVDAGPDASETSDDTATADTGIDVGPTGCPFGDDASSCLPSPPVGTPAEACPSGEYTNASDFDGEGICLPERPESPRTTNWNCPDDWESTEAFVDENGDPATPEALEQYTVCQPPEAPEDCATGFYATPGDEDCRRQGPGCPGNNARWHDDQTIRDQAPRFSGDIVFVDSEAGGAGNGTRNAPHETISAALTTAAPGDIVTLAAGTYGEPVQLDRRVALVGSCTERSTVRGSSSGSGQPTIAVTDSGEVTLANLAVTGNSTGLIVRDTSAETRLRSVALEQSSGLGLLADGAATLQAEQLRILETGANDDGSGGIGLLATSDSTVTVEGAEIRGNLEAGVRATGASTTLELRDTTVAGTRSEESAGEKGRGVAVQNGATFRGTRLLVDDNYGAGTSGSGAGSNNDGAGLLARGSETSVTLEDAVLSNTRPNELTGLGGEGIELRGGVEFDGTRVLIRANHDAGLFAGDPETDVTLDRALVTRTQTWETAPAFKGEGVEVIGGANLEATRLTIHASHTNGLITTGASSTTLTDTIVDGTESTGGPGQTGRGLYVKEGAELTTERSAILENQTYGVLAEGADTQLTLDDTTIADTQQAPEARVATGVGLRATMGPTVEATRLAIRRNPHIGLFAARPGTELDLQDTVVEGTLPPDGSDGAGAGLYLGNAADLQATRLAARRNDQRGIILGGAPMELNDEEMEVSLTDTIVTDTHPEPGDDSIKGGGLQVSNAVVDATRLLVENNRGFGVGAFGYGTLQLEDAVVAETRPQPGDQKLGYGLHISGRDPVLDVDAARLRIRDNRTTGVAVRRNTDVQLRDIFVSGTTPQQSDDAFGDGIYLMPAPEAPDFQVERALLRDNHRAGSLVSNRTGEFVDSLLTENRLGLVREGETDLTLINTRVAGNEQQNEQCRRQCYEEPDSPTTVGPGG
jgi:nitrous oxidase accessory protein NosD